MPDMSARGATPPMASVPSSATELIHVIEHEPASNVQQVGNVQVFADHVFDGSNRKRIGQDHGFCVHIVVPNQPKTWECMYTTELPGGWITIEGTSTDAGMPPSAIIGGTGKYANARGYMLFRVHNKAATEFDEFFHVTR
jgi:dirigent-like protein